ncbi:sulfonate ABC transporter [Paenibacillus lautus]|nr:sulfonate ABC transporter [Paenibacillus lautus]
MSGELIEHISISFQRAFIGFLIGGGIGLVLGFINGLSSIAEKLLDTTIQMVRNVPHLAMIPLVVLWFGIGEESKIFLVAIGVLFPVYINTLHGIRSVDNGLIEMGNVYGLRSASLFWRVVLPGALPSILVGLRYALGIMWLTLIVSETIATNSGIGFLAMNAREYMQTDIILLTILLYALFGKLADSIAKLLEKRFLQWNPNYQK